MMTTLIGLACVAMMALMCLPMAVGMLRSRFTRRSTTAPAAARGPAPPHRATASPTAQLRHAGHTRAPRAAPDTGSAGPRLGSAAEV
jgi:hypothetical protein